jgi:uncharacterized membrane protein YfcA
MDFSTVNLGFIFAGFFVGFLVGLTGVGGGSLMTPILLLLFHSLLLYEAMYTLAE